MTDIGTESGLSDNARMMAGALAEMRRYAKHAGSCQLFNGASEHCTCGAKHAMEYADNALRIAREAGLWRDSRDDLQSRAFPDGLRSVEVDEREDYYAGRLFLEWPQHEWDDSRVRLRWEAFQGGGACIVFDRPRRELAQLRDAINLMLEDIEEWD